VLAALARGMARPQVVVTFEVSLAPLKRCLPLHRTAAPLTSKTSSGRRRTISVEHQPALCAHLETDPDATLAQHTQRWNTTQRMTLSARTRSRALARLGWTRKKRRCEPPHATSRHEQRIAHASRYEPAMIWWLWTNVAAISSCHPVPPVRFVGNALEAPYRALPSTPPR
jgi:transposase